MTTESIYTELIQQTWDVPLAAQGFSVVETDATRRILPQAKEYGSVGFWRPGAQGVEGIIIKDMKFRSEGRNIHGIACYAVGSAVQSLLTQRGTVGIDAEVCLNGNTYNAIEIPASLGLYMLLVH